MEQTIYTGPVKSGTICGTLLVFFANISSSELMKTALLAAVGAAVSFIVSFLLKMLFDHMQKREKGNSSILNDHLHTKNDQLRIKNDQLRIKNDQQEYK